MSNKSKISFAIAAAVISVGASLSLATPAKATSLADQCSASINRSVAVRCCTTWIKNHGTPIWMEQSGGSCQEAVACKAGPRQLRSLAAVSIDRPRCSIVVLTDMGSGSSNPKTPPVRGLIKR